MCVVPRPGTDHPVLITTRRGNRRAQQHHHRTPPRASPLWRQDRLADQLQSLITRSSTTRRTQQSSSTNRITERTRGWGAGATKYRRHATPAAAARWSRAAQRHDRLVQRPTGRGRSDLPDTAGHRPAADLVAVDQHRQLPCRAGVRAGATGRRPRRLALLLRIDHPERTRGTFPMRA